MLLILGYIAGGHYSNAGGGNEYICVTDTPTWEDDNPGSPGSSLYSTLYGTEYENNWPFRGDNVEG